MARRHRKAQKEAEDTLVDIVDVRDQATGFVDKNQGTIFAVLVGLVLLIGAIFLYNNYFKGPRLQEAADQMYHAQRQLEKDSFALALTNPAPGFSGFLDIIENYGSTPAANTAQYYAGICYLNLGEYQKAIDHLSDFSAKGNVLPIMKYGAMGDAYSELNEMDNALSYYQKAANSGDNEVLVPQYLKKIGMWNEKNNNADAAKKAYLQIKEKYPTSSVGQQIDKYLSRVGG